MRWERSRRQHAAEFESFIGSETASGDKVIRDAKITAE